MLRSSLDAVIDESSLDALVIQVQDDAMKYNSELGTHIGEPIKLNRSKD